MLSAPPTASRNNGVFLPSHSEVNSLEWGGKKGHCLLCLICLHMSLLYSHVCLFLFRRCSRAEGCGQSSGALQTNRHALCSLLPQTQRFQRRDGGAAVRWLGWPGMCWKDLALPRLNIQSHTTAPFIIYLNPHFPTMSVCFCMSKCFLLPLQVVSPYLALHRLKQCSSHPLSAVCMCVCVCFTHWPHSHLFHLV